MPDFLVGEYEVITMALSYASAIVFPTATRSCRVFSVVEDSGCLARLAAMLDHIFVGWA